MANQLKKGETKNQHYVPQFYQRLFSIDGKSIGAVVLSSGKIIDKAPIKDQSSKSYFYSDNMKIEQVLGKLESLASEVIQRVIARPKEKLSEKDNKTLYVFTMLQQGRTMGQARLFQDLIDQITKIPMRKEIELKVKSGDADFVDMTDDIINNISVRLRNPALTALGIQTQLIDMCIDLSQKVLINKTNVSFVTSDNPVAFYDQFIERMGEDVYALGSRGLQIFFPMNPQVALFYYDPKCYKVGCRKKNYVEVVEEKDIFQLNKLTASNAESVIYFKSGSINKIEIEKLVKCHESYSPKKKVVEIPEIKTTNNSVIIGSHKNCVFCKLSLSFIKELPAFKVLDAKDFNPIKHRCIEKTHYSDELIRFR